MADSTNDVSILEVVFSGYEKEALDHCLLGLRDIDGISIQREKRRFRSVQPELVAALIGAVGTALSAVISHVLQIARERKLATVTVQVGDIRLEMPSDADPELIERVVKLAESSKAARLLLTKAVEPVSSSQDDIGKSQ